jgi:hypothetical protein
MKIRPSRRPDRSEPRGGGGGNIPQERSISHPSERREPPQKNLFFLLTPYIRNHSAVISKMTSLPLGPYINILHSKL